MTINSWITRVPVATALVFVVNQSVIAIEQEALNFNYPGGVVELFLPRKSDVLPQVRYGIQEPVIIQQRNRWRILVGISLDTLPGEYVLYVKETESELPAYTIKFNVDQKSYPVLEVAETSGTRNIQHAVISDLDFTNTEQPKLPLMPPIAGQWADFFGHVEADPEQDPKSSEVITQNYVSLTTTELAIVTAPQNAIVTRVETDQSQPSIATVYLDHGRGLYSIISGLTDLSVEPGNGIVAGAVIGKLPMNADLPAELIWQCMVNGVYINPLIMTRL